MSNCPGLGDMCTGMEGAMACLLSVSDGVGYPPPVLTYRGGRPNIGDASVGHQ